MERCGRYSAGWLNRKGGTLQKSWNLKRAWAELVSQCCFVADGLALATNVGTTKCVVSSRGNVIMQGGFFFFSVGCMNCVPLHVVCFIGEEEYWRFLFCHVCWFMLHALALPPNQSSKTMVINYGNKTMLINFLPASVFPNSHELITWCKGRYNKLQVVRQDGQAVGKI